MTTRPFVLALAVASFAALAGAHTPQQTRPSSSFPALNVDAIAKALGRPGQMTGDVYKVSFPRTDLDVSVGGVRVRPGLALGSWAAFRAGANGAAADGDLVLTEGEVNPVISALQQGGFEITALHNHLLHEVPRVMYVHFWGRGDGTTLARGLRNALSRTKTPLAAAATPATQPAPGFDAAKIQRAIGLKGTVNGGVLSLSRARPEPVAMMGVELPPSMGMATSINIQDAGGGTIAATGDFVLTGDEVNLVAAALRTHGIDVTALHNHMIHGSPELYFMHFWAHDTPDRVAAGLKAALDRTAGAR